MRVADSVFVGSFLVLAATGLLIAHPRFAMSSVLAIHFFAAIAFVLAFGVRRLSLRFPYVLALLNILTGFALYAASAHIGSPMKMFSVLIPLFGGLQTARLIHHLAMWLLPLALIVVKLRPVTQITGPCE